MPAAVAARPGPATGQADFVVAAASLVRVAPHLVFFPGLAIVIGVVGFNLLADGIREALDPRMRR